MKYLVRSLFVILFLPTMALWMFVLLLTILASEFIQFPYLFIKNGYFDDDSLWMYRFYEKSFEVYDKFVDKLKDKGWL